jgi:hypothetical protein
MIYYQKLRVGTEKPYDNRNAKDIVSLRLKKCGTLRPYRITKDIAILGIAIARFCCILIRTLSTLVSLKILLIS